MRNIRRVAAIIVCLTGGLVGCMETPRGSEEVVNTSEQEISASRAVVAYQPTWAPMPGSSIPWGKVTHINVAFGGITWDGTQHRCGWLDNGGNPANYDAVVSDLITARTNAGANGTGTKILLSVGGWTLSNRFSSALAAPSANLDTFVDSCVHFALDKGMDGLDWDWEYPTRLGLGNCTESPCSRAADITNYATLLQRVKAHSLMSGKLQTAAVFGNWGLGNDIAYPYSAMNSYLDMVNVMTYDLHGNWEYNTGFTGDFTAVQTAMNSWKSNMTTDTKLNMGVPFYSYRWDNVTSVTPGSAGTPYNPPNVETQFGHNVIQPLIGNGCTLGSSGDNKYVYCSGTQRWYDYHDTTLVATKMNWVKNNGLGGGMFWMLTQDLNNELTTAMFDTLNGGGGGGDTQAPTVPGSPTTSGITADSITLNWNGSSDNVAVANYKVYNGATYVATLASTARSYAFTGLSASTSYTLKVLASDAAGNDSGFASATASTSAGGGGTCPTWVQPPAGTGYALNAKVMYNGQAYISIVNGLNIWSPAACGQNQCWNTTTCSGGGSDTQAPTAPSNLSTGGITTSAITLDWTASTDNVGVTGYKVFKNGTQITTVTGTNYQFTGLSAGTTYALAVSAYDAANNNSGQTSINASTTAGGGSDTQAPTVPGGLATSGITANSITLSWSASSDNVAVTGYKVFRNGTQITTVTGTSYQFNGLAAGTTYTLAVSAYDAANNNSGQGSTSAATSAGTCPTWVQPPAGTGYALNAKVMFNGQAYISIVNGLNIWSPSVCGQGQCWNTTTCP